MADKPIRSDDSKGMTAALVIGTAAIVGLVLLGKKQSTDGGTMPEAKFSNLTATFS